MTDHLAEVLATFRPTWMRHAACAGMDQDLFFPPRGDAGDDAKRICEGCPVRANCLEWGLTAEVGIFGGVSLRDRQKLNAAGWQLGDPLPTVKIRSSGISHGTERAAQRHRTAGEPLCPACRAQAERRRARIRRNDAKRTAALRAVA